MRTDPEKSPSVTSDRREPQRKNPFLRSIPKPGEPEVAPPAAPAPETLATAKRLRGKSRADKPVLSDGDKNTLGYLAKTLETATPLIAQARLKRKPRE